RTTAGAPGAWSRVPARVSYARSHDNGTPSAAGNVAVRSSAIAECRAGVRSRRAHFSEARSERRDEFTHLSFVHSRRARPLVQFRSPVLVRRVGIARGEMNVEMRHSLPEYEGVDVLGVGGFPQGPTKTVDENTDRGRFDVGEVTELSDVSFRFDDQPPAVRVP